MLRKSVLLLLVLLLLPTGVAAAEDLDSISLTFRQAQLGDDYRFWNGEGYLQTEVSSPTVLLQKGSSEIRQFSPNLVPIEEDEAKIRFAHPPPDAVEVAFLADRPGGHGYYVIDTTLPAVNEKRLLHIEIENGDRILYSNIDFKQQKSGGHLTLEAETTETHIQIYYLTRLANMVASNLLAAVILLGFLLAAVIHRRKTIGRNIRENVTQVRTFLAEAFHVERTESGYGIRFGKVREEEKTDTKYRFSLTVPDLLLSLVIIAILAMVFVNSLFAPVRPFWNTLGSLQYALVAGGFVYALLSFLFIASYESERGLLARIGIVGGGIVGIMFGFLGWISVFLAVMTAMLIYLLSVLVLEEDEEAEDVQKDFAETGTQKTALNPTPAPTASREDGDRRGKRQGGL